MAKKLGPDTHSYSNYHDVIATHYHLQLRTDFTRKIFHGHVDITLSVKTDGASFVMFDTKALAVERVEEVSSKAVLHHTLPEHHESLGVCLKVPLPESARKAGATTVIRVFYNTTEHSGGIQWFEPSQTNGKRHPYVYTQCEAILARTLLPCMDTPAVKAPYTIAVSVPSPLVAACSGTAVGQNPTFEEDGFLTYHYEQKLPIPAYLIAIVAGALKKAQVGPRSFVWTEKELLDASVYEFSADTEKYVQAGEEITGIPYSWGLYDMVVLPNAFPYGGMENPQLTFLSASLLAGDRSLTNVVAHEIAHSWAGNFVSNSSWTDFWINEGFCVYLERLILAKVNNSQSVRHFEMLIGYNDLKKTVADLGADNEFTKLQPDLTGIDPDEAFSKIPYEKGSLLLYYLETKVGGQQAMLGWINAMYTANMGKSVSTEQVKEHFITYFTQKGVDVSSIDWKTWLTAPGLPPFDPSASLANELTATCDALAQKWLKNNGEGCTSADLDAFSSKQKMYFLDVIITNGLPMKHELLEKMDQLYGLSKTKNVEIACRYIVIGLKSKYEPSKPLAKDFLSIHGRGLYVRPLFRALNDFDHAFAVEVYRINRTRFHSVIRNMFDPLLLQ